MVDERITVERDRAMSGIADERIADERDRVMSG
jgi:hypothetical protein